MKVTAINEHKRGPSEFAAEIETLKAAGKLPSLAEVLVAVESARAEFVPKILAARKGAK
jgi:hypothetical protein